MRNILFFIFIINTVFAGSSLQGIIGNWVVNDYAKVRLISSHATINEETNLTLGLHFKLEPGWKIYWFNPGDSGMPPKLSLENIRGIDDFKYIWPYPEISNDGPDIVTRVYKGEVVIPIEINLSNPLETIYINRDLEYQICKEICIPIKTKLNINIPVGKNSLSENIHIINKYKSKVPKDIDLINIKNKNFSLVERDKIRLRIKSDNKLNFSGSSVILNSYDNFTFESEKYELHDNGKGIDFFIRTKDIKKNWNNIFEKDINIFVKHADTSYYWEQNLVDKSNFTVNYSYLFILITAFFGGIILNFMPCVLPVLGIKVANILNKNVSDSNAIKISSISSILGIVTTFITFSLLAIILRKVGIEIGWGMQFQQPIFLMLMIIILTLFILNLLGFYKINLFNKLSNILNAYLLKTNTVFVEGFFSGVLVTLLATPCTAPLVGTAISFALTSNYITTVFIFSLMGLGMALPYFVILIRPSIILYLPKPGKWMNKIKYILAFFLFCTVLWLGDILTGFYEKDYTYVTKENGNNWEKFYYDEITSYLQNNKVILVDITAKWCITCKLNKHRVLNDKEVITELNKSRYILLRGDWTYSDENLTSYINMLGRAGIPLNVIYSNKNKSGIILPEILTKKHLLETLRDN